MGYLDAQDRIEIVGAAENNLKEIDVSIPKGKLTVFVGVSGSGKSSTPSPRRAAGSGRRPIRCSCATVFPATSAPASARSAG